MPMYEVRYSTKRYCATHIEADDIDDAWIKAEAAALESKLKADVEDDWEEQEVYDVFTLEEE